MAIGAQLPNYGTTGAIIGYNDGNNYTQNNVKTTGSGRYINGVWTPDGSAPDSPSPIGSNLSAPTVAGFNGSNPSTPAGTTTPTGLPSYNIASLAKTIPGLSGTTAGSQFSSPATPPVAMATSPSTSTALPNYAPPTDPALAGLTAQSNSTLSQEFNGQLPQDVQQQIQQQAAERGISSGVNSPNSGAAYLRALGLNSLDMVNNAQKAFQPIQLADISQNGDNYRAILDAKSALDQLNVSQQGETSRFNAGAQNDLNKQVLSGQQALQQLSAKGGQDIALALINATAQQQDTILKGAQAMQQLQAAQSGEGQRLDATLQADLQKQVLAGQQSLAQINAQGANQRANTAQQGNNELDQILAKYSLDQQANQNSANQYSAGYNSGVGSGAADYSATSYITPDSFS